MKAKLRLSPLVILLALALMTSIAACQLPIGGGLIGGKAGANPAAVFCSDQGFDYKDGKCYFPDGSSCDGWEFYNGECSYIPQPQPSPMPQPFGMTNPASSFCVQKGYKSEIEHTPQGDVGYCVFPDGSKCEEWAFYRGQCSYNPQPRTIVGQGGTKYFTFQAVGPGETDLVMKYVAPDGTVAKTERYHIVVVG